MKNQILVKYPKNWGLDESLVVKLAQKALNKRGYKQDTELSIFFVGSKKAKQLNQQWRKMDYIPQVLGFPMSKEKQIDGFIKLGDVVICTQKLKYEAMFQKKKLEEILEFWLLHGVDNLL